MNKDAIRLIEGVADVLCYHCRPETVMNYRKGLRAWIAYCTKAGLVDWKACDQAFAERWITDLEGRGLKPAYVVGMVAFPLRCLARLKQSTPSEVHPAFEVPTARFPAISHGYRGTVLRSVELDAIESAALAEIAEGGGWSRHRLIPHLVLFVLRTGMNVDSALSLRRRCVECDDDGVYCIVWDKPRARRQLRDYYPPMEWGPGEILTEVGKLHEHDLLFSVNGKKFSLSPHLATWCKRHGLPHFQLRNVRASEATRLYVETGDILLVQQYLHHRSANTTLIYLAESAVRPVHRAEIADAMEKIYGGYQL